MKQETNNEMDLLLRRLARRQETHAPDAEDHLDADELSAYAENALPSKTRARYTAHLAECSRCRDLVVQLSASAGVVIAEQTEKVSGPSGLRKFLASLFSPMVLKYAAPALGLIVVAVIGFAVLRQHPTGRSVLQVQNEQTAQPTVVARTDADQKQVNKFESSSPQLSDSANKETATRNQPQQPTAAAPQATPAAVEQNADVTKAPAPKPEARPATVASEPPPPVTATVEVTSADKQIKNEDADRKLQAAVKVAPAEDSKANFEAGKKRDEEPATARSRVAKSKPVVDDLRAAQGAAAPGGARRDGVDREEKDSIAETKSVAGKQFRKQRGIWVDTAYDNSMSTTSYSRNTESYRSLIADEPGIKTIADQLDGEFIVVWKGRAYRIR